MIGLEELKAVSGASRSCILEVNQSVRDNCARWYIRYIAEIGSFRQRGSYILLIHYVMAGQRGL